MLLPLWIQSHHFAVYWKCIAFYNKLVHSLMFSQKQFLQEVVNDDIGTNDIAISLDTFFEPSDYLSTMENES